MATDAKSEYMQAFPWADFDAYHKGMSLRDYLAAKAMQALISSPGSMEALCSALPEADRCKGVAAASYAMAQAMLEERAK